MITALIIISLFVALFLAVLGIAFGIRSGIYKRELREFANGNADVAGEYHEHICHHMLIDGESMQNTWIVNIERALEEERMICVRRNESFCCFTKVLSNLPFKVVIRLDDSLGDVPSITFDFYDRYLQPVMTKRLRQKFRKRMESMFSLFEKAVGCV